MYFYMEMFIFTMWKVDADAKEYFYKYFVF